MTNPLMIIGGEERAASDGRVLETINPATGEVLALVPCAGSSDVEDAVRAASTAFPAWRAISPVDRTMLLNQLADAVEAHAEELALLDCLENGTPLKEMRKDAISGARAIRYFAGLVLELRGDTVPAEAGRLNFSLRQPFGVVGRIIPFNHPLLFIASKCAAPLAAGNTLICKPSELTSLSAVKVAELAADILPPGVFNVVTGTGEEAGEALVRHPLVRRIAFTGSVSTGRLVQQHAAAEAVKTVSLELGGKNPIVVLPDADLDAAVDGAVRGMNFSWQGQSCGSTSRLLVHASLRDEFVTRLAHRLEALRSGPPQLDGTDTGSMISSQQYDKVMSYIDTARADGARVVAGGGPCQVPGLPDGLFIRPTLLEDVAPGDRIAQEEIFGPVMVTLPFTTLEQAISISNGVSYGLTASIYTRDLELALCYADQVQAGMVWVNDSSTHMPGLAFGGTKDSGVGREENREELVSYTETKSISIRLPTLSSH